MRNAFKAFRRLARRYWSDGRHSGLETVTRWTCYHSAAVRCAVEEGVFARYWRTCIEPVSNRRMFAFNEHLTGRLDAQRCQ